MLETSEWTSVGRGITRSLMCSPPSVELTVILYALERASDMLHKTAHVHTVETSPEWLAAFKEGHRGARAQRGAAGHGKIAVTFKHGSGGQRMSRCHQFVLCSAFYREKLR
jgi:hypothetical protein